MYAPARRGRPCAPPQPALHRPAPHRPACPALPRPRQAVFLELAKPAPSIKLLYVTPEQLVKGARLKDALQRLDQRVGRRGAVVGAEAFRGWRRALPRCCRPSMMAGDGLG